MALSISATNPAPSAFITIVGSTQGQFYGGSGKPGNPHAFEIKDFSFGVENPTTIGSATGGAGAGKIKFNEFTIKKENDTAPPRFFRQCLHAHATQEVLQSVTIEVVATGPRGPGRVLKTVTLKNVTITQARPHVGPPPPGRATFINFTLSPEGGPA